MARRITILCLATIYMLAGCGLKASETETPLTLPANGGVHPTDEPIPEQSQTALAPGILFPAMPISLTVWTVESFSPFSRDSASQMFMDQLQEFDQTHLKVQLDVIVKKPTGPGSIEAYLDIASQVAPDVLPDLTMLSTGMIPAIMQPEPGKGTIIQALDELAPADLLQDLFPVAKQLGDYNGSLVGIPFMLDFEHLIYNAVILTDTRPTTWDAIMASGGPYIFPAAEDALLDTTLLHYLSAGGALYDQDGKEFLEIDPLTKVFRFYQQADASRVIPVSVLQTRTLAQSFNEYRNDNALVAHVNASQYLLVRDDLKNTAVAPFPGMERPGATFASGWTWAVITTDPVRQQMAIELLTWLMDAERLGSWSFNGKWLPASESALEAWPANDEYVQFAREQIMIAVRQPDNDYYEWVQTRLPRAVRDVLLGNVSPAAAASYTAP